MILTCFTNNKSRGNTSNTEWDAFMTSFQQVISTCILCWLCSTMHSARSSCSCSSSVSSPSSSSNTIAKLRMCKADVVSKSQMDAAP